MANHQRCWLWGRHLVRETLEANRWPIHELHVADRLADDELASLQTLAGARQIPLSIEPARRLSQLAGVKDHQGLLAKMGPFPYAAAEDVLQRPPSNPLYVILDSMQDAYNFGAVIRSAEVFGAAAVMVGERNQASVNSLVARSSVGAVNRVPIVRVTDLAALIHSLQAGGVRVVGASEKGDRPIYSYDFTGPVGLVIGNEGTGISPAVQAACSGLAQIPQQGKIGSLNAAVAAGIALYEVARQR